MKRFAVLLSAWLVLASVCAAATRTSSQSGDWSNTATWGGAAAPGDGDAAVISTGHTVTVTADVTVGSNSANVGHAVTINATNSGTFGKLVVNDGVTLTLKGNDTGSNTAMSIARYAQFEPQPGAIIQVDATAQYETIITNNGIINAIGTLAKPITFRGTAASATWSNSVASEAKTGTGWVYDYEANIATRAFTNAWIANAAGTTLGSLGDSSVSFSSKTPSGICATEVGSIAAVDAVGEYYIDYDQGLVYFYHDEADGNPSFTLAYKYLTYNGWGIKSTAGTTYNEAKFDYCIFQYMGGSGAREYALDNRYHYSTTSLANCLFKLTNSTISYCRGFCSIRDFAGTSGDPILITGNTFNQTGNTTFVRAIGFNESAANSYINITGNTLNTRNFLLIGNPSNTLVTHTGIKVENNSGICSQTFVECSSGYITLAASTIDGNTISGAGVAGLDSRMLQDVGGASGDHLLIRNNAFRLGNRFMSGVRGYVTMYNNIVDTFPHHFITAPVVDDIYCPQVYVYNNLFFNRITATAAGASAVFETGYNHRHHLDDWRFYNNTLGRGCYGILSIGDTQDSATYTQITGLVCANNVAYQPRYGVVRNTAASNELTQAHIAYLDSNLVYSPVTATVLNFNKQATFIKGGTAYNLDGTRNVLGVALWDPLYTLPESTNRSLVLTYTSATNQTLAWGGGTAVQLVVSSGTATSATNSTLTGSLTDSGKSWSTSMTSGTVVRCKWVRITGGTGSGQVRAITNNTATVLTVVPAWTTTPDATSTYSIIESEVQLFDSGATNYVRAGIDARVLPASSQTDSNITITAANLTTDPLLTNASGNTAADYKVSGSSPVIGAAYATYAPSLDYFGTTRTTPDMGFYEYVADSAARPQMIISQLAPQRAWQRFISLTPMALVK